MSEYCRCTSTTTGEASSESLSWWRDSGPHAASTASSSILVNSKSRITHLKFAKVFWNYAAEGSPADAVAKPAGSLGKFSDPLEKLVAPRKKTDGRNVKKSDKSKQFHQSLTLPSPAKQAQGKNALREIRWF